MATFLHIWQGGLVARQGLLVASLPCPEHLEGPGLRGTFTVLSHKHHPSGAEGEVPVLWPGPLGSDVNPGDVTKGESNSLSIIHTTNPPHCQSTLKHFCIFKKRDERRSRPQFSPLLVWFWLNLRRGGRSLCLGCRVQISPSDW